MVHVARVLSFEADQSDLPPSVLLECYELRRFLRHRAESLRKLRKQVEAYPSDPGDLSDRLSDRLVVDVGGDVKYAQRIWRGETVPRGSAPPSLKINGGERRKRTTRQTSEVDFVGM